MTTIASIQATVNTIGVLTVTENIGGDITVTVIPVESAVQVFYDTFSDFLARYASPSYQKVISNLTTVNYEIDVTAVLGTNLVNGIFWPTQAANVDFRRPWNALGATTTIFQWVAVDGSSFIPNIWLPLNSKQLNLTNIATYPWAAKIVVGTPGLSNQATARTSAASLAALAQEYGTLIYPSNVTGFYFPVTFDPSWVAAPTVMAPLWSLLPRPLYVTVFYDSTVDGATGAAWANSFIPTDVTILFQDGVGTYGTDPVLALTQAMQLKKLHTKLELVTECFRPNPAFPGSGSKYIPITVDEYYEQLTHYEGTGLTVHAYDGPDYLDSELIQEIKGLIPTEPPVNLKVIANSWGDIMLQWTRFSSADVVIATFQVEIYDVTGANVVRRYTVPGTQLFAVYPVEDSVVDRVTPPTSIIWRVYETSVAGYQSDPSITFNGPVVIDNSFVQRTVLFLGHENAAGQFTTASGSTLALTGASTFRRALASQLGLQNYQVMPVSSAYASSVVNKSATTGSNYWWDLTTASPGPRMTQTAALVTTGSMAVTDVYWFNSFYDAVAMGPEAIPGTSSSLEIISTATAACFDYMVATFGAQIKIWIQGNTRGYYGQFPLERYGQNMKDVDSAYITLINDHPSYRLGSWGDASLAFYTGYLLENVGVSWTRTGFLPVAYQNTAIDLATTIGTNGNEVGSPPEWRVMDELTGFTVIQNSSGDLVVSWTAVSGWTYMFANLNTLSGAVLTNGSGTLSTNQYTFTNAAQIAAYGAPTLDVVFNAWGLTSSGSQGPNFAFTATAVAVPPTPGFPVAGGDYTTGKGVITFDAGAVDGVGAGYFGAASLGTNLQNGDQGGVPFLALVQSTLTSEDITRTIFELLFGTVTSTINLDGSLNNRRMDIWVQSQGMIFSDFGVYMVQDIIPNDLYSIQNGDPMAIVINAFDPDDQPVPFIPAGITGTDWAYQFGTVWADGGTQAILTDLGGGVTGWDFSVTPLVNGTLSNYVNEWDGSGAEPAGWIVAYQMKLSPGHIQATFAQGTDTPFDPSSVYTLSTFMDTRQAKIFVGRQGIVWSGLLGDLKTGLSVPGLTAVTIGDQFILAIYPPDWTPGVAHKYWRAAIKEVLYDVNTGEPVTNKQVSVGMLSFRDPSGWDIPFVGSIHSSSNPGTTGHEIARAFEYQVSNSNYFQSTTNPSVGSPVYMAFSFDSNQEVETLVMSNAADATETPYTVDLQYSDDGVTWTTKIADMRYDYPFGWSYPPSLGFFPGIAYVPITSQVPAPVYGGTPFVGNAPVIISPDLQYGAVLQKCWPGQVLTALSTTYVGIPTPTVSAGVWLGASGDTTTGHTYTVQVGDVGSVINYAETATNSAGSVNGFAQTPMVYASEADGLPIATVPPTISGALTVGSVITAVAGTWEGTGPITFSGSWSIGPDSGSATGYTYTLVESDVGFSPLFYEIGTNTFGNGSAHSNVLGPVTT